ncbi:Transcription regulatory protein SNF2 [Galdieria sulphuraria]|nr:Transcription regulatory protein SNF2 [Galdieria sulphuraria]
MERLLSGPFNSSVLSTLRREAQRGDHYNMVSNVAAGTYMNGLPSNMRRSVSRVERRHKQELEERRRARHRQYLSSLMEHVRNFRDFHNIVSNIQHRMVREVEKYHKERAREEERRQKKAQQERLKALKENDEEAYFKLLQNTKNTRLMQLLRQTDIYLSQIGAQVRRQKELAESEEPLKARVKERKHDSAQAAAAQALEEAENTLREGGSAADTLEDMRRRRDEYYTITHSITEEITEQPNTLVGGTLKPYQLEGLQWLISLFNNNLNGILADEMGLGKTIQTIACLCYLMEKKNINGPFLIVVPLSTMSNWIREFDQWAPHIVKVIYRGDPTTRRQIQQHEMVAGTFNVLLTTYEYVIRDKSALSRVKWRYIIIDEGHRMKNAHCKLAMTLGVKYHSRNRLLLTGTPLQNNLHELWALLNFLLPNIFSSSDNFEAWFNAPFQSSALGETAELDEEETMLIINRLHQVLRPFLLRRMKSDVESQLPEKTEHVINCELSAWQKVLYRQISSKGGIAIREGSAAATFNNLIMQMRKVCNHPFLFYYDEDIDQLPREYVIRASGKFLFLSRVLPKLRASGHRVLIFTQMRKVLDFLQSLLEFLGIKFLRLDGTTKSDERVDLLEAFNDPDSEYFAFLLSTRAGGLGLNLQSADTVIIFDSDWNPMMDMQAQDRAHRIGQTREVKVFRLVCSGTVEEKILEQAQKKLNMDAQVIQAGQFNNRASDLDRRRMLEEILRRQQDDSSRDQAQDDEDTNRMLARSDEEFELFCRIDKERNKSHPIELLEDESELPQWILNPREDDNNVGYTEAKLDGRIGRWRRAREEVMYSDNLTEREWDRIVEEGGDIDEALRKKKVELEKRRKLGKRGRVSWRDKEEDASMDDLSDSDSKAQKKHRRLLVKTVEEEEEEEEEEEGETDDDGSDVSEEREDSEFRSDSEVYGRHSRPLSTSASVDDTQESFSTKDWTSDNNSSENEDDNEMFNRVPKRLEF